MQFLILVSKNGLRTNKHTNLRKEMASMATGYQWLNTNSLTRLRDSLGAYSYAMPIGLVKPRIDETTKLRVSIFAFAHSRSVPISRGSPPTS